VKGEKDELGENLDSFVCCHNGVGLNKLFFYLWAKDAWPEAGKGKVSILADFEGLFEKLSEFKFPAVMSQQQLHVLMRSGLSLNSCTVIKQ
jgi:hypothetical protein